MLPNQGVRCHEVERMLRQKGPTMRIPTGLVYASTVAVLLAWSGCAFAQPSSIELIEVSTTVRIPRPASTRSVGSSFHDSELRRASRARDSVLEKTHQQRHSHVGARHAGASAGLMWQSEVAEHRHERRGATAGKGGGSRKGNGQS